jgi:hypothetical protein
MRLEGSHPTLHTLGSKEFQSAESRLKMHGQ